jgi:vacuolar protein sorting-associated protein 33A
LIEPEVGNLIYLIRPSLQNVQWIATQLKSHQQKRLAIEHTIYFVPRRSLLCDKYLEEEGIYGDVTLGEFHLDIIPFDDDIISLDLHNSFRDIFLEGDTTIVQMLSNALMKFQILYGFFPKVIGKGDQSNVFYTYLVTCGYVGSLQS